MVSELTAEPVAPNEELRPERTVVFICKATPSDDEFALWLAPKLEAAGYSVFADIVTLEPGDRWRSIITSTLQTKAAKMLLCCSDTTLASEGVQEEIGIALDLAKELNDPRFVIPLRLQSYKKLFGIGSLQYIDFVRGWAEGLDKLLEMLRRQKVPRDEINAKINPNWEIYRRRGAVALQNEPERLTSNWMRVAETPDYINYFESTGALDRNAIEAACKNSTFPTEILQKGFVTFRSADEINAAFASVGRFEIKREVPLSEFMQKGLVEFGIRNQEASNVVHSMFRQAWNAYCRERGLLEYHYSNAVGFHVGKDQTPVGQKIPWGKQGERRSSMLRNIAKGHVWQFGVTAIPAFWPFPHFKLKSRVLFASILGNDAGSPLEDPKKQHRLRRTVCKGWRNKQWHGRLRAFIELLSGDSSFINLPLGETAFVRLEASPMLFSSPVSTALPNALTDDDEEQDVSTLGRPELDEES